MFIKVAKLQSVRVKHGFFDASWTPLSHSRDFTVTRDQFLQLSEIREKNKADVSIVELRPGDTQVEI